jgi:two-component system response regulator YesN
VKNRVPDEIRGIDMENAGEMVESFAYSCKIPCRLLAPDGAVLVEMDIGENMCGQCRMHMAGDQECARLHQYGIHQSDRFGGRYIYLCAMGMGWTTSPILLGGQIKGALSAGPIMIMDRDDYIAGNPALQREMPPEERERMNRMLNSFPRRAPAEMNHVSLQLLAAALYIGDSSIDLARLREQEAQQGDINEHLQQFKLEGVAATYPREKEKALIRAITDGDQKDAQRLLNELLGHIIFSTGGNFLMMRARSLELMALLSRAAADGGADLEHVLSLNQAFLLESDNLRSADDLIAWLTKVIVNYSRLVFDVAGIERKDVIYKAINFIKRNLHMKISLQDVARHVGFSYTHFSKVFKDEMGMPFNVYLNKFRVERSKALLLSDRLSIQEVCDAVGYADQSYFVKVFKKYTGVTPGNYRKKQGRLDSARERNPD